MPNPDKISERKVTLFEWVREAFTALTAVVTFIAGVLGLLVLYATNKGLFADLSEDYYKWLYDEDAWTGLFNNYPEGVVDMPSMNLSDTNMQLVLTVHRGEIDGVMSEKRLCEVGFPHGYKLVKGQISALSGNASVTVWDIEQGYPKDYAEFNITREGVVVEVTPKSNSRWFGSETIRLAQHPYINPDKAMRNLFHFCQTEDVSNLHWLEDESEEPKRDGSNEKI